MRKSRVYKIAYAVTILVTVVSMTACGNKVTYDPPEEAGNIAQQIEFALPVENNGEWYYDIYTTVDGERTHIDENAEGAIFKVEKKTAEEAEQSGESEEAAECDSIIMKAQNKGKCEIELSYWESRRERYKKIYNVQVTMEGQISILSEDEEVIDENFDTSNIGAPIINQQEVK